MTHVFIGTYSSYPIGIPFTFQGIPRTSHLDNYLCIRDQFRSNRLHPATNSSLATDRRPSCSAMHLSYRLSLSSTRFQIHKKNRWPLNIACSPQTMSFVRCIRSNRDKLENNTEERIEMKIPFPIFSG